MFTKSVPEGTGLGRCEVSFLPSAWYWMNCRSWSVESRVARLTLPVDEVCAKPSPCASSGSTPNQELEHHFHRSQVNVPSVSQAQVEFQRGGRRPCPDKG